ncbi:uncharacterized protein BJ212DRAFT_1299140 [Suillus subaureus]|uniref:Uncharacterized protein n=1 Tax=Suillus subaureus TaxID=48587 RepID=A0A9P7ECR1_9AGAM|nr:uncharacterized protein BJ212DRAFT_1299140 [Suillus subaureus]KAG1817602.1 hypothetical protein BJ212DRAFT_1299140 [Suillus subaureus]
MIEAELSEIVKSAEVMQKCHLPICAMMGFQTAHTLQTLKCFSLKPQLPLHPTRYEWQAAAMMDSQLPAEAPMRQTCLECEFLLYGLLPIGLPIKLATSHSFLLADALQDEQLIFENDYGTALQEGMSSLGCISDLALHLQMQIKNAYAGLMYAPPKAV